MIPYTAAGMRMRPRARHDKVSASRSMVVGVCQLRLFIHNVFSLKEKRSILKRIITRVHNKFMVSIAEVGDNDIRQSALIGFCMVGNDRSFVNACLDTIIDFIDELYLAEIVDQKIEIISMKS